MKDVAQIKYSNQRESGIELLKIFAIFFIVVSHVAVSVGQKPIYLPELFSYLIDTNKATTNAQYLLIAFFRYLGGLGNNIFLICSFFFLSDSKKIKLNKIIVILLDAWIISVSYLLIYLSISGEILSVNTIIKSFFPTLFHNTWFVTCYLLLYMIHPLLNIIIHNISQKTHLIICLLTIIFYCFFAFLKNDILYYNSLVYFVCLYFWISYLKKYLANICANTRINIFTFSLGFLGLVGLVLFTNYIGIHYAMFDEMLLKWNVNNNIFIIVMAISLFNIFRKIKFYNICVNYMASCSLIVYLIHENVLFSNYTRVRIWVEILKKYGTDFIVLQAVLYSIILFGISYIVSIIYKLTINKVVLSGSRKVERYVCLIMDKITSYIVCLK